MPKQKSKQVTLLYVIHRVLEKFYLIPSPPQRLHNTCSFPELAKLRTLLALELAIGLVQSLTGMTAECDYSVPVTSNYSLRRRKKPTLQPH